MSNPYETLPASAFWRSAVAEPGPFDLHGLWEPKFPVKRSHRIVTAGSCFAQHIGRALAADGYGWHDAEPAPPFLEAETAKRYNCGIFSFRTGNIYTARMLNQWLELAFGNAEAFPEFWEDMEGRFFDPLRPSIEPDGFASLEECRAARARTAQALRSAVETADIFIFTLGLTESWVNVQTGMEYAACLGTSAGSFDPARHKFENQKFAQIRSALNAAIDRLKKANANLRVVLTVSPVPLTATASGQHVLTATSHSKSVLRAVAGEIAQERPIVDYFPSYEIITHPVFRGMFYAPNMRSVVATGVKTVMGHFFAEQDRVFPARNGGKRSAALPLVEPKLAKASGKKRGLSKSDVVCEEEMLDAFRPQD